jgi:hypothetical protein
MLAGLDWRRLGQGRALQPLVEAINGDKTTAMLEGSLPNRLIENRLSPSVAGCVDFETIRLSNLGRNQPQRIWTRTRSGVGISPDNRLIGTWRSVVVGTG